MNSLCLCSAVDRLTVMALLSLKFIGCITSYKITWYFLCQIATDRRIQLQNKYLNKYLKVLRRFLFIHRGSTGQSGFLRNFRKLMKEAKCIGKNLILQIFSGLPIRMKHPGLASRRVAGALMCWAYTHQSPCVLNFLSKFSLHSCRVTLLFFLGFLLGFISTTLSQRFSFFDRFKARVLLFRVLLEAHTCI